MEINRKKSDAVCYWRYTKDGSIIIAGPTKFQHEGYFRSLTSARRYVTSMGYAGLRKDSIGDWKWPTPNDEVFPLWTKGQPDPDQKQMDDFAAAEIAKGYANPTAVLDSAEDFPGDDL